jgi:ABC-2 type transport system permease protein
MPADQLFCGFGLAVLYIVLAGRFFAYIFHHAVRDGLIARYSAESVS